MAAANHPPSDIERDIENAYKSVTSSFSPLSSDSNIYRVPNRLRKVNEKAYTPQLVCIGPLHLDNEGLRVTYLQNYKWRYLRHFIYITKLTIRDCVQVVKEREDRIRRCYAEPLTCLSVQLVAIIMVDAVFIIEILLRFYTKEFDDKNDQIYYKPWIIQHIVPDLLLLENQIPFFVVEDIFERAKQGGSLPQSLQGISIAEVCYKFFRYNVGFEEGKMECPKFLHFVDLGRKLYIPEHKVESPGVSQNSPPLPHGDSEFLARVKELRACVEYMSQLPVIRQHEERPVSVRRVHSMRRFHLLSSDEQDHKGMSLKKVNIPTITRLHRAGVKFNVGPEDSIKMKFVDGILELPKLHINDNTEIFLRNVIAFEQCNCDNFTVTNYFVVLKRLVGTPQDLELLVEHGIVDSMLGDNNDVFKLITKLADEVTVDYTDSELIHLCKDMEDYCKVTWHKWKANLKQIYFDTPWTTLSVTAASIILILTLIQTACSIRSLK